MAQRVGDQMLGSNNEEFIGTVDVWTLRHLRWPFMRVFARGFVEKRELCDYERRLLASGRWRRVRCSPHPLNGAGNLYDFYGVPHPGA